MLYMKQQDLAKIKWNDFDDWNFPSTTKGEDKFLKHKDNLKILSHPLV